MHTENCKGNQGVDGFFRFCVKDPTATRRVQGVVAADLDGVGPEVTAGKDLTSFR